MKYKNVKKNSSKTRPGAGKNGSGGNTGVTKHKVKKKARG